MIVLLALNDEGAPSYAHDVAASSAEFGVPVFACTPDLFPNPMAAAINRSDIAQWAASADMAVAEPFGPVQAPTVSEGAGPRPPHAGKSHNNLH